MADTSLAEMNKKLYRIAQLSAKASSEEATASDKRVIQEEINKLRLEVQNVGEKTVFNNQPVFSNVATEMNGTGAYGNQSTANNSTNKDNSRVDIELEAVLADINNVDVTTQEGATKAVNKTLQIMSKLHDAREKYISKQDKVEEMLNNSSALNNSEQPRDTDSITRLLNALDQIVLEENDKAMHVQSNKVNKDVLALLQ